MAKKIIKRTKDGETLYFGTHTDAVLSEVRVGKESLTATLSAIITSLTNYYTKNETYSQEEVDQLVSVIKQFNVVVAASLPTASASTMNTIYLIPSSHSEQGNVKDEFITIQDGGSYKWEQIGSTAVDLSGYSTTTEMNTAISNVSFLNDVKVNEIGIDDIPTEGSNNLVKSGGVFLENGILNISLLNKVGNSYARYATFDDALQAIPEAYQYSGLQIKFVDTLNKYRYYRMTSISWSSDSANWVEDNPTDFNNAIGINVQYLTDVTIPDNEKVTSNYMSKEGVITTAASNYFYVKLFLEKGLYYLKDIGGYNSNVAILSATDSTMSEISPVIIDSNYSGKSTRQSFVFERESDGYVVFSGNGAWNPSLYKLKPYGGVVDYVKRLKDGLDGQISDLSDLMYVMQYTQIANSNILTGYIMSNGDINSSATQFRTYQFPVTAGTTIKVVNTLHQGTSYSYALYSSSSFSSSTAITVGPEVTATQDETIVTVPQGAAYLGITYFHSTAECYLQVKTLVSDYVQTLSVDYSDKFAYSYDGVENLYAACIIGSVEYLYWFKRCMSNNLYTFYRVGYRNVTRNIPSVNGITGNDVVMINETSSDNIGPFSMVPGGWVGGNHLYPTNTSSPNYKTAETTAFEILVDGGQITTSVEGYCESIVVNVHNIIYDPSVAPEVGDEILSTKLSDEYVSYAVRKNNIEVSVSNKFVGSAQGTIGRYYGMQSMFQNEEKYITPNGEYTSWVSVVDVPTSEFSKEDYPNFNRFIEKSETNSTYQAAYMTNKGLGDYSEVTQSDFIFNRSSNKCYHHLISHMEGVAGKFIQWNGIYTFFKTALVDNSNVLAYDGYANGRHTLFINTMQAFSGFVPIPNDMVLKDYSIIERLGITDGNNGEAFILTGEGIYISSSGTGSLIISI